MIRPELLDILRCPETHQKLKVAPEEVIARLNSRIKARQLQNRAGKTVNQRLEAALLREDGDWLYPVRSGLPVMLIDEALPVI